MLGILKTRFKIQLGKCFQAMTILLTVTGRKSADWHSADNKGRNIRSGVVHDPSFAHAIQSQVLKRKGGHCVEFIRINRCSADVGFEVVAQITGKVKYSTIVELFRL